MKTQELKEALKLFKDIGKASKVDIISDSIELSTNQDGVTTFTMHDSEGKNIRSKLFTDEVQMKNVVVPFSKLYSLISLIDSPKVSFYDKGDYVMIITKKEDRENKYKLEKVLESTGEAFHVPCVIPQANNTQKIDTEKLIDIYKRCDLCVVKPSPTEMMSDMKEKFTKYAVFEDKIVTTNSIILAFLDTTIPFGAIRYTVFDVISKLKTDVLELSIIDKGKTGYLITTDNIDIFLEEEDIADDYPRQILEPFKDYSKLDTCFEVDRDELIKALKRTMFSKSVVDKPLAIFNIYKPHRVLLTNGYDTVKEELNVNLISAPDEGKSIVLQTDYLIKVLNAVEPGVVSIYVSDPNQPYAVIKDALGFYVLSGLRNRK